MISRIKTTHLLLILAIILSACAESVEPKTTLSLHSFTSQYQNTTNTSTIHYYEDRTEIVDDSGNFTVIWLDSNETITKVEYLQSGNMVAYRAVDFDYSNQAVAVTYTEPIYNDSLYQWEYQMDDLKRVSALKKASENDVTFTWSQQNMVEQQEGESKLNLTYQDNTINPFYPITQGLPEFNAYYERYLINIMGKSLAIKSRLTYNNNEQFWQQRELTELKLNKDGLPTKIVIQESDFYGRGFHPVTTTFEYEEK